MGIELELAVLLGISILGQSIFAPFEIETPPWRKILKWAIVVGSTLSLYVVAGHWSLVLPLAAGAAGTAAHFVWCGRHGIDPIRSTPKRKYYELRGWRWVD